MSHLRVLLAVALLGGCDFYDDPEGPVGPGTEGDESCSTEIVNPRGLTGELTPADPHQDVFGADPEPYQVLYQWVSSDPSRSAGFLWRTDLDTLSTVIEWGEGDALDQRAEGATFTFDGDAERMHEVHLCGDLEPDTTYSYRVGGEGHWSPTYTFTTPGEPGSFDTVRVAIAGDSRGAYTTWETIIALAEAHEPDLYLFSGDMVELGTSQGEWNAWFEATGDLFTRKGLVVAHGNHEFLAKNYFAQFALPGNEEWFSVDYGPLHIVSLNDTIRDVQDLYSRQVNFMDADLTADTTSTWQIAMHHRPIYSSCSRHGSDEALRAAWGPAFDRNGVDVVIAGHNHIYERSVPMNDFGEVPPGRGTVYLVSGGAGAPLYEEVEDVPFNDTANPIEHYIIADFGPQEAHFIVRDLSDNVIDDFTVQKRD